MIKEKTKYCSFCQKNIIPERKKVKIGSSFRRGFYV